MERVATPASSSDKINPGAEQYWHSPARTTAFPRPRQQTLAPIPPYDPVQRIQLNLIRSVVSPAQSNMGYVLLEPTNLRNGLAHVTRSLAVPAAASLL